MRYLLDTHALIWWLNDNRRLTGAARAAVAQSENEIYVSAATGWEVATKHRLGKLPQAATFAGDIERMLRRERFLPLDVSMNHAQEAGRFVDPHRDPFDRMLIAQAIAENLTLISNETMFDRFGVRRLW